jgi:hypothetical protein
MLLNGRTVTSEYYMGHFIIFSMIQTSITRKPKDLLNRIVHSHRKTEKVFIDNERCLMHAPWVTWYTLIRYSSSCHKRVNMGALIFFTAAMIRAFRSVRSHGNGGTY